MIILFLFWFNFLAVGKGTCGLRQMAKSSPLKLQFLRFLRICSRPLPEPRPEPLSFKTLEKSYAPFMTSNSGYLIFKDHLMFYRLPFNLFFRIAPYILFSGIGKDGKRTLSLCVELVQNSWTKKRANWSQFYWYDLNCTMILDWLDGILSTLRPELESFFRRRSSYQGIASKTNKQINEKSAT